MYCDLYLQYIQVRKLFAEIRYIHFIAYKKIVLIMQNLVFNCYLKSTRINIEYVDIMRIYFLSYKKYIWKRITVQVVG
jgi:hypothetical protein